MPEVLQIKDVTLDLSARRVFRAAEVDQPGKADEIELGKLTFDLLEALVHAAPAALSTDEIVAQVWQSRAVSDETVQQRVSLLRRALGHAPGCEYVETVRGFGYRLAVEPRPLEEMDGSAMPTPFSALDRFLGALGLRLFLAVVAVLVVLALLTVLALVARQLKRWTPGELPVQVEAPPLGTSPQRSSVPASAMSAST